MLENYLYYYGWIWIVLTVATCLMPGPGAGSTQSTRVLGALLGLPIIGRILGWW